LSYRGRDFIVYLGFEK